MSMHRYRFNWPSRRGEIVAGPRTAFWQRGGWAGSGVQIPWPCRFLVLNRWWYCVAWSLGDRSGYGPACQPIRGLRRRAEPKSESTPTMTSRDLTRRR